MKRDVAALGFALAFPSVMTWLYFVQLTGPGSEANPLVQLVVGLGKLVQFAFPVVFVWLHDRAELGWPIFRGRGFFAAVGFGLLAALAIFVVYFGGLRAQVVSSETPDKIWHKLVELNCTTPLRFVLLAVLISLVHSLLEEYYWRWFVFGWLRQHIRPRLAILISSLGFMAHHVIVLWVYFPGNFWSLAVPFSLGVAAGGAVWAWLYDYSRSLYGIWVSHLIVDAAIMIVGFDMIAEYF